MSAHVVEYSRFVEVRHRRARVAAELIQRSPETPVARPKPPSDTGAALDRRVSPLHRAGDQTRVDER